MVLALAAAFALYSTDARLELRRTHDMIQAGMAARDAASLLNVLEHQVIPLYYDRDIDGLPRPWIRRMMNSISSLAWRFSADRMVADYVRHAYLPAAGGLSCDMNIR